MPLKNDTIIFIFLFVIGIILVSNLIPERQEGEDVKAMRLKADFEYIISVNNMCASFFEYQQKVKEKFPLMVSICEKNAIEYERITK